MIDYSDIEKLFLVVQSRRWNVAKDKGIYPGDPETVINDEEREQCFRWANGQELQTIVNTPGYEVLMSKLNTYMDDSIKNLLNTSPTDKEAVLAKHAVAFASFTVFERLKNDIAMDLEAAKTPPDIVKEGLRITKGIPIDI